MLSGDRRVGGLWCSEVLEQLSEYLDGTLPPDSLALVRGHVVECARCAAFGDTFAAAIADLRSLREPPALDTGVAGRLRARLGDRG